MNGVASCGTFLRGVSLCSCRSTWVMERLSDVEDGAISWIG